MTEREKDGAIAEIAFAYMGGEITYPEALRQLQDLEMSKNEAKNTIKEIVEAD